MLDIFTAPDASNMELRETASRAIRTTIGYGTSECQVVIKSTNVLHRGWHQSPENIHRVQWH